MRAPCSPTSSVGFALVTIRRRASWSSKHARPVIRWCQVRPAPCDPRLYGSRFDYLKTDICQSVMASFFVRAAAGDYELEQPDQLLRLLVVMTRRKLANQKRRHCAERRDCRRMAECDPAYLDGRMQVPSPSRLVGGRELLAEVSRRLSKEERLLADLRGDGYGWTEIAARLGGTADARPQTTGPRAVDRVRTAA